MTRLRRILQVFRRDTRGVSMVEFAFVIIVLLLIVLGTIEFGLIWYTKYIMACATREGARYATLYHPDASGNRILPCNLDPTIETVVTNYLNANLPPNVASKCTVPPLTGACYTLGTAGVDLAVTVTCSNPMNLLGGFLPGTAGINLRAETIMKCE